VALAAAVASIEFAMARDAHKTRLAIAGALCAAALPAIALAGEQFVQRQTVDDVAREWHSMYLHWHFQDAGYYRYGYAERHGRYDTEKFYDKGHMNPLVWTGQLRDACRDNWDVTSSVQRNIMRATAFCKMDVSACVSPRKGYNYALAPRKHKPHITAAQEITALNDEEARMLGARIEKRVMEFLAKRKTAAPAGAPGGAPAGPAEALPAVLDLPLGTGAFAA
jgi:hypothetical protein